MWVTKLLISPVKKRIFCPKTTKFGPKLAFLVNLGHAMQAYSMPCCGSVGCCGARAVSRKTPIYFIVFTFVFVCILVPYILLTNVCRSTYVSCQLCVVLFPFHSSPVHPLAHHQTCASVLTAPSPSSQPTPAALSAIFLFLLFIVSTFSTPPISLSCRISLHRCLF